MSRTKKMGGGHTIDLKLTKTPPHPKNENNNIDNNQMKMSKFDLTES